MTHEGDQSLHGQEAQGFNLLLLGQRLREARGKRTLRETAKSAGISPAYLLALEKGSNPKTKLPSIPSIGVSIRLSETLGIDKDELLAMRGAIPKHQAELLAMVDIKPESLNMGPAEYARAFLKATISAFKGSERAEVELAAQIIRDTRLIEGVEVRLRKADVFKDTANKLKGILEGFDQALSDNSVAIPNSMHVDLENVGIMTNEGEIGTVL